MSWPTTLADFPDLMRELAVDRIEDAEETAPVEDEAVALEGAELVTIPEVIEPLVPWALVWAPCCGRKTPADTIISTQGLSTIVKAGNLFPARNHEWLCDGCQHLLILDQKNDWTWSKLFRAVGAPEEAVLHFRAREIENEKRLEADGKGEAFNPETAYEEAIASLPKDTIEIPGTEIPTPGVPKGLSDV